MSYLIKVGGSLIPTHVARLFQAIKKANKKSHEKIYLFPGGGSFADLIRIQRKKLGLGDGTTHKMALASLDQNAYLIADLCDCPCFSSLQELKKNNVFPAVIAPYEILLKRSPFKDLNLNIDILSSSSSALYMAHLLRSRFIIATDVDGIYDADPKKHKKARLFPKITTVRLRQIKRGGALDETIPQLIDFYGLGAWVINGRYPSRILAIMQGAGSSKAAGTLIVPSRHCQ